MRTDAVIGGSGGRRFAWAALTVALLGLVSSACGGGSSKPPARAENAARANQARPPTLEHSPLADRDYHMTGLKGFWVWQSGEIEFPRTPEGKPGVTIPIGYNKDAAETWLPGSYKVVVDGGDLAPRQVLTWGNNVWNTHADLPPGVVGDEYVRSYFGPPTKECNPNFGCTNLSGVSPGQTYRYSLSVDYGFKTYDSSHGTFTVPN